MLGSRRVTFKKLHSGEEQILGTAAQNLFVRDLRTPAFRNL